MAEEAMVKDVLDPERIRAGEELTKRLDEARWPVDAALWFYKPADNVWRLIIASPALDQSGPHEAYKHIHDALAKIGDEWHALELKDVSVVSPREELVQTLRAALRTGPAISGIRFSRNVINGHFIDDAYIYRLK